MIRKFLQAIFLQSILCVAPWANEEQGTAPQATEKEEASQDGLLANEALTASEREREDLVSYLNTINQTYIKNFSSEKFSKDDAWITQLISHVQEKNFTSFVLTIKNFDNHLKGEYDSFTQRRDRKYFFALGTLCVGSIAAGASAVAGVVLAAPASLFELFQLKCNDWHCPDGYHLVHTTPEACYLGPTNSDCAKLFVEGYPPETSISPKQVSYEPYCSTTWTSQMVGIIPYEDYIHDHDQHCAVLAGELPYVASQGLIVLGGVLIVGTVATSGALFMAAACQGSGKSTFEMNGEASSLLREIRGLDFVPESVKNLIKQMLARSGSVEEVFFTGVDDPLLEEQRSTQRMGTFRRCLRRLFGK